MDTIPKIKAVGFEIEGEFNPIIYDYIKNNTDLGIFKGDASIHNCPDCRNKLNLAEFNSNVFYLNTAINYYKSLKEIKRLFDLLGDFKKNPIKTTNLYKNNDKKQKEYKPFCFNDSMGFHIHISFNPEKPENIFCESFYKYFIKELKKTYPTAYKKRFLNKYCYDYNNNHSIARGNYCFSRYNKFQKLTQKEFEKICLEKNIKTDFDKKLFKRYLYNSTRYHSINFGAFNSHKTIEFRIYPTDTPEKMLDYLVFTIKTTKEWLKKDFKEQQTINIPYRSRTINKKDSIDLKIFNEINKNTTQKTAQIEKILLKTDAGERSNRFTDEGPHILLLIIRL